MLVHAGGKNPRRLPYARRLPLALALGCLMSTVTLAADFTTQTLRPHYRGGPSPTQGTPTALVKGDLNADGSPDLVATYATGGTGVAAIHRGNPAWLYGQGASSPFLDDTPVVQLPTRPDFAAVGDFNGDRHHDLVIATRGETSFVLLPGLGNGAFGPPVFYPLPGALKAFAAGEFGLEDGAPDLAFATAEHIHLYESLRGALRGAPHVVAVPSPHIHAMAMGTLDDAVGGDLALAASDQPGYWVLSGDDCRLTAEQRDVHPKVQSASVAIQTFLPEPIEVGEPQLWAVAPDASVHALRQSAPALTAEPAHTFAASAAAALPSPPVASVAMRLTPDGQSDYVFLVRSGALVLALSDVTASVGRDADDGAASASVAALDDVAPTLVSENGEVNFPADLSDGDLSDGICDTGTRTRRTGLCTLRAVIETANASGVGTNITFLTPEVLLTRALPALSVPIIVDGRVNGVEGTRVRIASASGTTIDNIFLLQRGTAFSAIRHVVFNDYVNAVVLNGGNSIVEDCYFGFNTAGTGLSGTSVHAIITGSNLNMIGGTTPEARNLITAFHPEFAERAAVIIGGEANRVQGNYIGTDRTGQQRVGAPTIGVIVRDSAKNFIGGTDPGAGNVIVGAVDGSAPFDFSSTGVGVYIYAFNTPAEVNRVQGNHIGVALDGQTAIPNRRQGIVATGNFTIVQHNVVSGNQGSGLFIDGTGFAVLNNRIGTDAAGRQAVPNFLDGIEATARGLSNIGWLDGRNVIAGNGRHGLVARSLGEGLFISSNYIGVNSDGTVRLPNGGNGINISGSFGPIIGGVSGGNVVSGNLGHGLVIATNSPTLQIKGNIIGLGADGSTPVGNGQHGVQIQGLGLIGGNSAADRNIISANVGAGINALAGGGTVLGNAIGTDSTGTLDRGNGTDGVLIADTIALAVGGLNSGDGNRIAFNRRNGIFRAGRIGSIFLSNEIFANDALGIDTSLSATPDGPNPQTAGINQLLNAPVLLRASSASGTTTVTGSMRATAGFPVLLQFFANPTCDGSGFGEGRTFLGSQTAVIPATGSLQFNVTLPGAVAQEMFLTATATLGPNTPPNAVQSVTSEFSNCAQIPLTCGPDISSQVAVTRGGFRLDRTKNRFVQTVTLRNISATPLSGTISLALDNLSANASLFTQTGTTACSTPISPYQDALPSGATLAPGASVSVGLEFTNPTQAAITYTTRVLGRGPR